MCLFGGCYFFASLAGRNLTWILHKKKKTLFSNRFGKTRSGTIGGLRSGIPRGGSECVYLKGFWRVLLDCPPSWTESNLALHKKNYFSAIVLTKPGLAR